MGPLAKRHLEGGRLSGPLPELPTAEVEEEVEVVAEMEVEVEAEVEIGMEMEVAMEMLFD